MRAGPKVPTFSFGFTHNNPPQAPYTQPVPQGPFCPSRGHSTSAAFIPLAVGLLGGCMVGLHAERVSGAFRCGFMHTNSPRKHPTPNQSAPVPQGPPCPKQGSFHLGCVHSTCCWTAGGLYGWAARRAWARGLQTQVYQPKSTPGNLSTTSPSRCPRPKRKQVYVSLRCFSRTVLCVRILLTV